MIMNVRRLEWQRRPYTKFEHETNQGLFVTVRAGTAYREIKMTKVHVHVYLECQYCISMIN